MWRFKKRESTEEMVAGLNQVEAEIGDAFAVAPHYEAMTGLRVYAAIATTYPYDTQIIVKDSVAANEPHVWLFITGDPDPHLNKAKAIELRDALTEFIETAE